MISFAQSMREKRAAFEVDLRSVIADAQRMCLHPRVGHWDGHYSSDSLTHPVRICLECGLEEKGGWWCYAVDCSHWHAAEGTEKVLANTPGRTITEITLDELVRSRP